MCDRRMAENYHTHSNLFHMRRVIISAWPMKQHRSAKAGGCCRRLPELVGNLSPASRAVVVLFYLHEMSLVETAAVLDIPVGTVKSRLAYGLESLRRSFKKE